MQPNDHAPRLNVHISGVVIPSWLAVCLLCTGILAAVALLLTRSTIDQMAREVRLLELHVQDLESAVIRSGVAQRSDFAPWDSAPKSRSNKEKEQ